MRQTCLKAFWALAIVLPGSVSAADGVAGIDQSVELTGRWVVPALEIGDSGVSVGGLSDLFVTLTDPQGIEAWTLTDRGPNGTVGDGEGKRRTLLAPNFPPTLLSLRIQAKDASESFPGTVEVKQAVSLSGRSGRPLSGRPNGVGRDEPILDAATGAVVAADQGGVDTEGLVVMPDGSFWVTEEYRPSLLHVSASGRVIERHVPAGVNLPEADTRVIDDLPAAYGNRRDNRGFEGLALSPDATKLFILLQSPLDHPAKGAGKATGNVRLLVADASSGRPIAEHVYRLGDPAAAGWLASGAPPEDGKLCALAALADGTLLVLEQADGGLARLYRVDPAGATDTLPRTRVGDGEPLETIADLPAAGIQPLPKTLVADLGPLLPQIRADIGHPAGAAVKLEGLAVLDDRRVLVVNDNDFGVTAEAGRPVPQSCLWEITLPSPLGVDSHGSVSAAN